MHKNSIKINKHNTNNTVKLAQKYRSNLKMKKKWIDTWDWRLSNQMNLQKQNKKLSLIENKRGGKDKITWRSHAHWQCCHRLRRAKRRVLKPYDWERKRRREIEEERDAVFSGFVCKPELQLHKSASVFQILREIIEYDTVQFIYLFIFYCNIVTWLRSHSWFLKIPKAWR